MLFLKERQTKAVGWGIRPPEGSSFSKSGRQKAANQTIGGWPNLVWLVRGGSISVSGKELDLSFFSKRRFFLKEWQFVDREFKPQFCKRLSFSKSGRQKAANQRVGGWPTSVCFVRGGSISKSG